MRESDTEQAADTAVIEKLVYGGDAISRSNGHMLFVPFALPGEEIRINQVVNKGKITRAIAPQVLSASSKRVEPGCKYFGRCGGCHYQHAEYPYQVEQKVSILRETLQRLGKVHFEGEIPTISAQPWEYRNRIKLHFEKRKLGYREAESHKLCAIDSCPISSPKLNQVIAALNQAVRQKEWPQFLSGLEIFTNETDVQFQVTDTTRPVAGRFFAWCAEMIPGLQPGAIDYTSKGRQFRISRGTFFQVNRFLVDALVDEVLGSYTGAHVMDLYAGAGLFSRPLSERFERVTAVERSGSAAYDLEHNTTGTNISAVRASTDTFLEGLTEAPGLIVADPPRTGLTGAVTTTLLRLQAERMVIVSCDPATLARDLQALTTAYTIERIVLVDLFPQTYHFETVVHLARKR